MEVIVPDRIARGISDAMIASGGLVGAAVAAVQTTPSSVWLGMAALITAIGGIVVKIAGWYTLHKGLKIRNNELTSDLYRHSAEIRRLRQLIVQSCNEAGKPVPIDLFDMEASDEQ